VLPIDDRHEPLTARLAIPRAEGIFVLGSSAWPGSRRATRLRRRSVCKQILCTFMAGRIGRAGMSYEYRGLQTLPESRSNQLNSSYYQVKNFYEFNLPLSAKFLLKP